MAPLLILPLHFWQEQAYTTLLSMVHSRGTASGKITTHIKAAGGNERASSTISATHTPLQVKEFAQKFLVLLDP